MSKYVITIARQFGSLGRPIAARMAEILGIEYYDRDIVDAAAKKMKLPVSTISDADETVSNGFFQMMFPLGQSGIRMQHDVFDTQREIILNIADKGNCIIVGRCADYALADYQNVLNVFIYGDEESKVKRIMSHNEGISAKEAKDMMVKKDKQRQSYYNYYSSKKWGRADSYDLCINSSKLGVEGTKKLIIQAIEDFENCR